VALRKAPRSGNGAFLWKGIHKSVLAHWFCSFLFYRRHTSTSNPVKNLSNSRIVTLVFFKPLVMFGEELPWWFFSCPGFSFEC
jgi:hypothetical protein